MDRVILKKIVIIILLFNFIRVSSQSKSFEISELEKQIKQVKKDWNIPGLAIAVIKKNSIIYSNTFGFGDIKNKKSVTNNTIFGLGSCTKAFTAALLGLLENEKKVDFSSTPNKYVSGFQFFNDEMNNSISIKELLTHSSGLAQHDMSFYLFPTNSKDSLINRIQYLKPFAKPREKYKYNNIAYTLSGVIAERITGISWEDNIKTRFLQPLKMTNTYISSSKLHAVNDVAFGYAKENDKIKKLDFYKFKGRDPAGSIYSSLNDVIKWAKLWLNEGKENEVEIIPSSYISNALKPQYLISSRLPKTNTQSIFDSYGYGWKASTYNGHYMVNHHGGEYGYSSMIALYPVDEYAIIILTNKYDVFPPYILRDIIADRVLNLEKTDWNKAYLDFMNKQSKPKLKTVTYSKPLHNSEDYLGTYTHKGYGSFQIKKSKDSLLVIFPEYQFNLKHREYDIFEASATTPKEGYIMNIFKSQNKPFLFKFNTNQKGEIESIEIDLEPSIKESIKFIKK